MVAIINDGTVATPTPPTPFDGKGWGQLVNEQQVHLHKVLPDATRTHRPIEHHRTLDYTKSTMDRLGFLLSDPTIYLSKDEYHSNMFASWGIAHPELPNNRGFQWQMFLINSHNKKFSLQVGAGHETFVCSNGIVMAPLGRYRAKHTAKVMFVDESGLPRWQNRILQMCNNVRKECDRYSKIISSLKNVIVDPDSDVHRQSVRSLCLDAALKDIVNDAGAATVYRHWINPEHDEFKADGTAWRLMQAFTSQGRGKSAFDHRDRMSEMFNLLSDEFGSLRHDLNPAIGREGRDYRLVNPFVTDETKGDF